MIFRTTVVATLAAATLSLAACGGSSDDTTGSTGSTGAAAPAVTKTTADTAQDCGGHVVDAVKKAVTSPAVQKIQVIGGCNEVSIETDLGPDAKPDGQAICEAASKVAYTGSVMSVSVDGADGHELAAGLKGEPCI
jgi:hypothetical protein